MKKSFYFLIKLCFLCIAKYTIIGYWSLILIHTLSLFVLSITSFFLAYVKIITSLSAGKLFLAGLFFLFGTLLLYFVCRYRKMPIIKIFNRYYVRNYEKIKDSESKIEKSDSFYFYNQDGLPQHSFYPFPQT